MHLNDDDDGGDGGEDGDADDDVVTDAHTVEHRSKTVPPPVQMRTDDRRQDGGVRCILWHPRTPIA